MKLKMNNSDKAQNIIDIIDPDNIQCSKCKKYFSEDLIVFDKQKPFCYICSFTERVTKDFEKNKRNRMRH